MRWRESAADFKLFADDHLFALVFDSQADDASRRASLDRFEFMYRAEIDVELPAQQLLQFILSDSHAPAVKVRRLLIEIGQNLSENGCVFSVTESGRRISNPSFGVGLFGQRQIESGGKLFAVI